MLKNRNLLQAENKFSNFFAIWLKFGFLFPQSWLIIKYYLVLKFRLFE